MKPGFQIALLLFLLCNTSRTIYEILKKSGKINPKNVILFALIFAAMCILWVSWFSMCPLDPWRLNLPMTIHWLGLGIFILGLLLAFGALIQLKGVENIDHLVTTGLFARLRHPMYLGFIFWIIGWAIFHGAAVSFVAGLVCIGNILYWRNFEETQLEKSYGDRYRAYRRQTWF
jgi:protein-S-isoprenylcysteine O-methyltransferase Ste14